jgi:hypothetical protein
MLYLFVGDTLRAGSPMETPGISYEGCSMLLLYLKEIGWLEGISCGEY